MSSIPNRFNSYGDDNMNHHHGFVPNFMNHNNSEMVRSLFTTSDHHMNHGDLFSPSPLTFYRNSHVSSSSFGLNDPHGSYHHMMRDTDSVFGAEYFRINDNPHFSQVSFTQTITNRYSAIVPTNALAPFHPNYFGGVMDSKINIWNRPTPTSDHPLNLIGKPLDILNPRPLNVVYPHQESAYRRHLDLFSPPSNLHNHNMFVPEDVAESSFRRSPKPTKFPEETADHSYFDSGEDQGSEDVLYDGRRIEDQGSEDVPYDGRTHSLPYEKYGPYTCPKCNGVFDTSQKFAAHMSSHYKTETNEEREERYRARIKNKYRKLNHEVQGESSKKIKLEDGASSSGGSDNEAVQGLVVVKKEHV